MKKALGTASIVLASLTLAACTAAPSLESQLRAAVTAPTAETLMLSSLDAADGESFLVVCPYESKESVDDRLGFSWKHAPDYSKVDDRQTVAVIDNGAVVAHAEFGRGEVDFCTTDEWAVLPTGTELTVSRTAENVVVTKRQ